MADSTLDPAVTQEQESEIQAFQVALYDAVRGRAIPTLYDISAELKKKHPAAAESLAQLAQLLDETKSSWSADHWEEYCEFRQLPSGYYRDVEVFIGHVVAGGSPSRFQRASHLKVTEIAIERARITNEFDKLEALEAEGIDKEKALAAGDSLTAAQVEMQSMALRYIAEGQVDPAKAAKAALGTVAVES